MDNAQRAEDAFRVINRMQNWGDNPDYPEIDVYDFLSNLHHLCDEQGWDWEYMLYMADLHYRAEVAEGRRNAEAL